MTLLELIDSQQYKLAIEQCLNLINEGQKLNDESTCLTGYVYLGIIYTRQKKYAESKKIFDDNYLEIIDECKSYWVGTELVNTYLMFGELEAANIYLNAYLEENTNDFRVLYLKGHVLYLKKEFEESIKLLLRAFDINNSNKGLLYNIAMAYQELGKDENAFHHFELAYQAGNNKAIDEIIKLLFVRTGICDFENCENPCCKAVKLKGVNALTVTNLQSFNGLVINDKRNSCWLKSDEDKNGQWIFECKNFGENNFCNDYENRPQTCRDYPSSMVSIRSCCSYKFELKENPISFKLKTVLFVVLDLLKAYKYSKDKEILLKLNSRLLSS